MTDRTPVDPSAWRQADSLPPLEAVLAAWTDPGPVPFWHRMQQENLRLSMPLLAHALDRLAAERSRPTHHRSP